MKINLLLLSFLLLTKLSFGQQKKSLLISTHLNTKTGKAVEKVNVVVDDIGACITVSNVKCFYPTLKEEGMSVSIRASSSNYVPINNLELKSYRLSNQKIDTVRVIMSLKAEREKYALAYFEKETGIIIHKRFEEKEKNLYTKINDLVVKMNDLKDKNNLAYQKLAMDLQEANKSLELVQKDKSNEESISQRLATTLSMLEAEEIPDYVSHAYSLFKQGNVEGADKALNANAIGDQIQQGKLKKKLGKLLNESGDKQINMGIATYLFKAQLKSSLYEFKEAEILFENAYKEDTNNPKTLFEYAYFLEQQNRTKRPGELYQKALQIYEDLAKKSPEQYLPEVANTLNNLGVFYKHNNLNNQALKAYERALNIYDTLNQKNMGQYLIDLASILTNLGEFYRINNLNKQSQKSLERALQIYEYLSQVNKKKYLPEIANTLNNLGAFYHNNNLNEQAKEAYERALHIYDTLALSNKEKYLLYEAITLNNLGVFYQENGLNQQAQKVYERALLIREDLSKKNPERSLPDLANSLNNLGVIYYKINLKKQALNSYERAYNIYDTLAMKNPEQFLPDVAHTLNNLSIFYGENNLKEQAMKSYERALHIYDTFAMKNPDQFLPYLAKIQKDFATFLFDEKLLEKSEFYCLKGLQNYQTLAIKLNDNRFWQKAKNLKDDILLELISSDSIFTRKLNMEKVIIDFNNKYPSTTKLDKVLALNNASYYALFCNDYKLAEDYAFKCLSIAPEQNLIYTNLALALLLQNRWDEAKQIYQEKQDLTDNDKKTLKESFLNDLTALEKAGITHPDFEKVRALLK